MKKINFSPKVLHRFRKGIATAYGFVECGTKAPPFSGRDTWRNVTCKRCLATKNK